MATLVNEFKLEGKYEVAFSSEAISNGVYFYTLISRDYSSTKKMIVLK